MKPTSFPPAGQANTDRPTTSVRHEPEVSLAELLAHKVGVYPIRLTPFLLMLGRRWRGQRLK